MLFHQEVIKCLSYMLFHQEVIKCLKDHIYAFSSRSYMLLFQVTNIITQML